MGKKGYKSKNKRRKGDSDDNTDYVLSTSNGIQANGSRLQIPGYYYDEEKKAYFKILPSSMNSVSSFVTKEKIKKKRDEETRLSDLSRSSIGNQSLSSTSSSSATRIKTKHNPLSEPLLNVLHSVQCGSYTDRSLWNYTMKRRCMNLQPETSWESRAEINEHGIPVEYIKKMEVNDDCTKAVTVWSISGFMRQYITLMRMSAKKKQDSADNGRHLNLVVNDPGIQGVSADKVTSMCWAPLSKVPGKSCVLYTSVCPVGYRQSHASISNLEPSPDEQKLVFSYELGKNTVWSCAWSPYNSRLSVGSERLCHIVDIETRRKWTYSTLNDSLALLFSTSNHNILYAGTRNGFVIGLDFRSPKLDYEKSGMNHRSPVVCLRLLKDSNYLLASDFSGLIRMWDVRRRKTVRTYQGLVNSHYQVPFYLDSTESFICAAGTNGYCHVWSMSDGKRLKTIAPPLPIQPDSFPVSHISDNWGGQQGNFGLVMGMKDQLFLYS